jgi:hypothetical protein
MSDVVLAFRVPKLRWAFPKAEAESWHRLPVRSLGDPGSGRGRGAG